MISNTFSTKVFYKDIDKMGIVYYSRYLEFFEQARTETLNNINLKENLIKCVKINESVFS